MGATELGKELRKFRVDRDETLKAMAGKLGVNPPYLSAIEIGKFAAPQDMIARLAEIYGMDKEQTERLLEARAMSAKKISLDLSRATRGQKRAALLFADTLDSLTEGQVAEIMNCLQGWKAGE